MFLKPQSNSLYDVKDCGIGEKYFRKPANSIKYDQLVERYYIKWHICDLQPLDVMKSFLVFQKTAVYNCPVCLGQQNTRKWSVAITSAILLVLFSTYLLIDSASVHFGFNFNIIFKLKSLCEKSSLCAY